MEEAIRQEMLRQLPGLYTALAMVDRQWPQAALVIIDQIDKIEDWIGMTDLIGTEERREQWRAEIEARIEEELK